MNKRVLLGLACVVAVVAMTVSALQATDQPAKAPREVTIVGKVVDLHCCMTGTFPSADQAKCTRECIRAGVPAALETETGLIVLGNGLKGAGRMVDDLAFQTVEAKGKLYERNGLRYLDLTAAKPVKPAEPPAPADDVYEEDPDDAGDTDDTGTNG